MNIRQKIGTAVLNGVVKTFGLSQVAQMWLAGIDTPDDNSSKTTRPYSQVALVYTCVNKLVASIIGFPLVLSTTNDDIIESGPAYELLFNNPNMSWQRFVTETIGHYALARDVFWVFTETAGIKPKEIMVISGAQMYPVTHNRRPDGELLGWEFRGIHGEHAKFAISEVCQWKNFNPYNKFHGLGPTKASRLNIDYSFAADLYNANALANGAEPGIILTTPGKLDEDQIRMIRNQFDARHKGAAKAKRTALLTGGLKAETVAMKLSDLQVAKITEMSDKKLCSTFGVPPGVAGLITDAQYSHGPAMRDFVFNTVLPLARLFAGELTHGILSRFYPSDFRSVKLKQSRLFQGNRNLPLRKRIDYRKAAQKAQAASQKIFAWFDSSEHPVVQEYQREVSEKVLKFTEAGVPLNDIIEAHDLPYEEVPWGKDWWVGMGQVPARYILEAGTEGITGPPAPEGQTEESSAELLAEIKSGFVELLETEKKAKVNEQQRLRLWRNWVISWAGIEREYRESLRQYFLRQQRILIKKLKEALGPAKSEKADTEDIISRVVFDLRLENNKIKVINQAFFDKASELGIRQSLSQLAGLTGDALAEAAERIKRLPQVKGKLIVSTQKITGINKVTQQLIAKKLQEGLEAGEGLEKLTGRIKTLLGSNRKRALRIARTQTAGAVSTGRHAGMKFAGVELKSWVTAGSGEIREAHIAAGQKYAEGIALDVPFEVGGELLMYPGDPSGSALNIINCRCLSIAIIAAGKTFSMADYVNHKFYSYEDMQKAA